MTASLCCFYEQLSVSLFKKSDRFRRTERISAIFSDYQAIFSDFERFSKNNIVCNPAAEKCQRFTEICLTNLWGMGKKWDSVQTPMSLFFVIYAKKSSFRERFSFSDFQRFWKSLKIAENRWSKIWNHDLSRKVIIVDNVHHSCQPAISLEVWASRSNSGNVTMFWADSEPGFGSPGPRVNFDCTICSTVWLTVLSPSVRTFRKSL